MVPSGLGSPSPTEGTADERSQQREDAAHYGRGAKSLRDARRDGLRETRRHGVAQRVREGGPKDSAYDYEEYRDDEGQQGHQKAMLGPGAACHPARHVAADQESQQEGYGA